MVTCTHTARFDFEVKSSFLILETTVKEKKIKPFSIAFLDLIKSGFTLQVQTCVVALIKEGDLNCNLSKRLKNSTLLPSGWKFKACVHSQARSTELSCQWKLVYEILAELYREAGMSTPWT